MQSEIYSLPLLIYGVYGIIATFFAALVNYLLLRSVKNIGNSKQPQHNNNQNGHDNLVRWASQTKPTIGGISLFLVFLLSVSSYYLLPFKNDQLPPRELFALLGSVSIGFIVGLIDDSFHIAPLFKFLGQIACAALMISMGIYIPAFNAFIPDAIFTTIWVVGIMNAINMLDNMDGIAAIAALGILLCATGILLFMGMFTGFYAIVFIGVIAALFGFLFFNWYPSKMYMGDSGSQFLGALLSFAGILFVWQFKPTDYTGLYLPQFVLPAVVFALPIIDTTTVFLYRLARKQSPFVGGRDHTTHHLAYCGISDRGVAVIFTFIAFLSLLVCLYVAKQYAGNAYHLPLVAAIYWLLLFAAMQIAYRYGKNRQAKP